MNPSKSQESKEIADENCPDIKDFEGKIQIE
jgi:hypothetical protein